MDWKSEFPCEFQPAYDGTSNGGISKAGRGQMLDRACVRPVVRVRCAHNTEHTAALR
jgi:hypothetical protein